MKHALIAAPAAMALCALVFSAPPLRAQGPWHVEHEWKLGGDGGWDYLSVDPESKLLYITRGDHVIVVDTNQGKQVADITGLHGVHCVVFSTDGVHGYITDGGANQVAKFNRKTNTIEKTIGVGDHPDGAVFDPATKTVWAFNGRGKVSALSTPAPIRLLRPSTCPASPNSPCPTATAISTTISRIKVRSSASMQRATS